MSDSRRGSLAPSRDGSRRGSRQGSICLAGTERRGSYYGDDVSKRSTVAVCVNDPAAKANMSKELEGVFDQGKINTLLFFRVFLDVVHNNNRHDSIRLKH